LAVLYEFNFKGEIMYIWDSFLGQLSYLAGYSQVEPEVNATQQELVRIKENIDSGNVADLAESLVRLCGPEGNVKINCYNKNLQIHLFFCSEMARNAALPILASYCKANYSSGLFEEWQLKLEGEERDLFPLKLSTNQGVALLAIDPREVGTFCYAQSILKNVKEHYEAEPFPFMALPAEPFPLMALPAELLANVCAFLPIKTIGSFSQTSIKALQIFNANDLWILFAKAQNIQLVETGILPLEQVKSATPTVTEVLTTLPEDPSYPNINDFLHCTREKIEEMGGVCLSEIFYKWDTNSFAGIVLSKENDKYYLVLCPGAGDMYFSEDDYDFLMPEVIAKLKNLEILPEYVSLASGRLMPITLHNFKAWQRKHQKPSS
jgi:hypothetical protein